MQKITREIRGIPFFLLQEYLQEMEGTDVGEDAIQGLGWIVHLNRMEPFRLGSLEVGQTKLEIQIEDDKVDEFMERFSKKTLRAGA
jgi:hypothetical protein